MTGELIYRDEFTEGRVAYGIKEELLAADTKPFILGLVAFGGSGSVNWQRLSTRISYRIYPDDKEGRILDVIVVPDQRDKGIARRLVRIAEKRMKGHGVVRVFGLAQPDIWGFWQKLGYKVSSDNEILKEL
ncbi:hypothetical protein ES703_120387 [subsurface metagenome]